MGAGDEWQPHHMYRLYDDAGRLLYAGIARVLCVRLRHHQRHQPWWPTVVYGTSEVFPDWFAAGQAERAAIADEHPEHNRTRALRPDDRSAASALRVPHSFGPRALPETLVDLRGYLAVPVSALGYQLSGLSKTRTGAGSQFPTSPKLGHSGHCHYCADHYTAAPR